MGGVEVCVRFRNSDVLNLARKHNLNGKPTKCFSYQELTS